MDTGKAAHITALVASSILNQFAEKGERWVTTDDGNKLLIGDDGEVKGGDAGAVAAAKGEAMPPPPPRPDQIAKARQPIGPIGAGGSGVKQPPPPPPPVGPRASQNKPLPPPPPPRSQPKAVDPKSFPPPPPKPKNPTLALSPKAKVNIDQASAVLKDRGYSVGDPVPGDPRDGVRYRITDWTGKTQVVPASKIVKYVKTTPDKAGSLFD